jgi:hypothetical protein
MHCPIHSALPTFLVQGKACSLIFFKVDGESADLAAKRLFAQYQIF